MHYNVFVYELFKIRMSKVNKLYEVRHCLEKLLDKKFT
jgi:hypothetical protein